MSTSKSLFIGILVVSAMGLCPKVMGNQYESETNRSQNSDTLESKDSKEKKDPVAITPPTDMVPEGLLNLGTGLYYSNNVIVLDKSTRTLTLWQRSLDGDIQLVKAYPSDYGRKEGDKHYSGDLKTPEGVYFFQDTYIGEEIDFNEYGKRAFTTNYPNLFDKREKKTGSGIWLHAIPPTKSLNRGSRGCVVVRNDSIDELANYISLGGNTPILIYDKVNYVQKPSLQQNAKEWLSWLAQWKASWTNQDLEKYMEFYSDEFKTQNMGKPQWKAYKKALNSKYSFINIKVNDPTILKHKDEVVVRFLQDYQSDDHSDFGEKVLYLKKKAGKYQIIAEHWSPVSRSLLASKNSPQRSTASKQN